MRASSVGGLSGAFIPVSGGPSLLPMPSSNGHLRLEKLEAMTSVCSVGLDMVAIPGDTERGDDFRHHRRRSWPSAWSTTRPRRPTDSRAGEKGRRPGDLRRPDGLFHHHPRQQRRRGQPVHPERRAHPRPHPQPQELSAGHRDAWTPRAQTDFHRRAPCDGRSSQTALNVRPWWRFSAR